VAGHLPLGVTVISDKVTVEGRLVSDDRRPEADRVQVGPDYFKTLGMPLIEGRPFGWHDDGTAPRSPSSMPRRPAVSGRALGARQAPPARQGPAWIEVVGVAPDGK